MKRLSDIGLKIKYSEDVDFKQWINSVFALALCPLDHIDEQWERVLENQPQNVPRLEEFLDYFVDNYFEGVFPNVMWNHFDNENRPRTNNNLEGYNAKLKRYIVVGHPNIFTAVDALKEEEVSAGAKYHRALQGFKPDPRKKLYVTKDGTYGAYKELFLSGDITIDVYMKRIIAMLVIFKKKRRESELLNKISLRRLMKQKIVTMKKKPVMKIMILNLIPMMKMKQIVMLKAIL
jgi:hypothetical protein